MLVSGPPSTTSDQINVPLRGFTAANAARASNEGDGEPNSDTMAPRVAETVASERLPARRSHWCARVRPSVHVRHSSPEGSVQSHQKHCRLTR